ncbi:MAG: hypothetical protein WCP96_03110 [Methylococcaceae bacterium]
MTNYRLFLLSFLTVSWVFLSGFNKTIDNTMIVVETQKTERELQTTETENIKKTLDTDPAKVKNNTLSVKINPQKITLATDTTSTDKDNTSQHNEFEKPLDLSVPFNTSESTDENNIQKAVAQSLVTNIFAPETKKKPQPLELKGGFLMSPEPELEKRKSVDGAGIVINLKP